ncbi:uncharacterized protein B0I36DRAFT_369220 [Microdochium trichocladiopsis]|uniref:Uncharacterized protein n=1 Tax=Microdochium trichocladiopsis TaxID=1682393 RepID=A0A9P8XTE1_9PEZI|nr:uncharacterized protein B0I36DRAFT_369220 [Microdochium trichocladiopsis]KAH7014241.1 hypothetical protein B0I36DRAFT_369220 [Microdochium trichocladiopsis]
MSSTHPLFPGQPMLAPPEPLSFWAGLTRASLPCDADDLESLVAKLNIIAAATSHGLPPDQLRALASPFDAVRTCATAIDRAKCNMLTTERDLFDAWHNKTLPLPSLDLARHVAPVPIDSGTWEHYTLLATAMDEIWGLASRDEAGGIGRPRATAANFAWLQDKHPDLLPLVITVRKVLSTEESFVSGNVIFTISQAASRVMARENKRCARLSKEARMLKDQIARQLRPATDKASIKQEDGPVSPQSHRAARQPYQSFLRRMVPVRCGSADSDDSTRAQPRTPPRIPVPDTDRTGQRDATTQPRQFLPPYLDKPMPTKIEHEPMLRHIPVLPGDSRKRATSPLTNAGQGGVSVGYMTKRVKLSPPQNKLVDSTGLAVDPDYIPSETQPLDDELYGDELLHHQLTSAPAVCLVPAATYYK